MEIHVKKQLLCCKSRKDFWESYIMLEKRSLATTVAKQKYEGKACKSQRIYLFPSQTELGTNICPSNNRRAVRTTPP